MDFGTLDGMDNVMAGRQRLLTPNSMGVPGGDIDIDIDIDLHNHNVPVPVPSMCMDADDHAMLPRVHSAATGLGMLPDLQHSDR